MKFNFGKEGNTKVTLVYSDDFKVSHNQELLDYLKNEEIFTGKEKEVYFDLDTKGSNHLYAGMGKKTDVTLDTFRNVFHTIGKTLTQYKVKDANIVFSKPEATCYCRSMKAAVEGLLQSQAVFDKYLSEKKVTPTIETITFDVEEDAVDKLKAATEEMVTVFEGITITRDLVNERAINMYPEVLANEAKKHLEPVGVDVEIFEREAIEAMNMEAFLSVSEGSDKEPRFIKMTYNGNPDSDETIALVGKGLTYDSGGYSLKPSPSMDTMYTDMGGSGTVIGTMYAIAKAGVQKNVVALVAACENLVDGSAYKPGDIIGSMSGKTIEVLNTDAEGRLTLADALWYAVTEVKADKVIDLATLTGACIVGLGTITTGAITNNDELMSEIIEASKDAGEPIWQLPANDEYRAMVKSDYADLVNTSKGTGAGTITAGLFLENFVNDTPWVHLDIAGTAYDNSARNYLPKGATGIHVKTLFNYLNK